MEQIEPTLADQIVKDIENEKYVMRPKWVVSLYKWSRIFFIIITFIGSAWFLNLAIYKFQDAYLLKYLSYGELGAITFRHNFPVLPILLHIVLFLVSAHLLKKYPFCYKRNRFLYFLSLLFLTWGVTGIMNVSGFNQMFDRKDKLPNAYHNNLLTPDWIIGSVLYWDEKGILIKHSDGTFFRAMPGNKNIKIPRFQKNQCIKTKGTITGQDVIVASKYEACSYKLPR